MSESKWIREKYAYQELKSSKIKSILYFGIVWSIFEKEVCNNNASINDSSNLASKLSETCGRTTKRKITLIWNYFLDRYIIFVMDAKNINRKLFTSAIKRELRDFFHGRGSKKSYLAKLNLKVDFISENLDEILKYFNIDDKDKWQIKKGFVVNTLYFSAFYEEKVDFVLLDNLSVYLTKKDN